MDDEVGVNAQVNIYAHGPSPSVDRDEEGDVHGSGGPQSLRVSKKGSEGQAQDQEGQSQGRGSKAKDTSNNSDRAKHSKLDLLFSRRFRSRLQSNHVPVHLDKLFPMLRFTITDTNNNDQVVNWPPR